MRPSKRLREWKISPSEIEPATSWPASQPKLHKPKNTIRKYQCTWGWHHSEHYADIAWKRTIRPQELCVNAPCPSRYSHPAYSENKALDPLSHGRKKKTLGVNRMENQTWTKNYLCASAWDLTRDHQVMCQPLHSILQDLSFYSCHLCRCHKISRICYNLKVHYLIHNSSPLLFVLKKKNGVKYLLPNSFRHILIFSSMLATWPAFLFDQSIHIQRQLLK